MQGVPSATAQMKPFSIQEMISFATFRRSTLKWSPMLYSIGTATERPKEDTALDNRMHPAKISKKKRRPRSGAGGRGSRGAGGAPLASSAALRGGFSLPA